MQSTFELNQSCPYMQAPAGYVARDLRFIRRWILFFMVCLFISGATAIPLEPELSLLKRIFPDGEANSWFTRVHAGLLNHKYHYPFMDYGYDWLAFAHFVLTILFIGPYRDPVRNKWVIEFGMIACLMIIPFALVAGQFRSISWEWRLIDCSFGIIGLIPLNMVRKRIIQLENIQPLKS